MTARVIFLNGVGSVGKSAIAKALQAGFDWGWDKIHSGFSGSSAMRASSRRPSISRGWRSFSPQR
jgi:hypothetical protein